MVVRRSAVFVVVASEKTKKPLIKRDL